MLVEALQIEQTHKWHMGYGFTILGLNNSDIITLPLSGCLTSLRDDIKSRVYCSSLLAEGQSEITSLIDKWPPHLLWPLLCSQAHCIATRVTKEKDWPISTEWVIPYSQHPVILLRWDTTTLSLRAHSHESTYMSLPQISLFLLI